MNPIIIAPLISGIFAILIAFVSYRASRESLKASSDTRMVILEVKNQLLQFENVFLDRLNGRYVSRKESDLLIERGDGERVLLAKELERLDKEIDELWTCVNKTSK